MFDVLIFVVVFDVLIFVVVCLSFLPSIIGLVRHHKNLAGIFILNLFLGWTFIGWVVALIWSASDSNVVKEKE